MSEASPHSARIRALAKQNITTQTDYQQEIDMVGQGRLQLLDRQIRRVSDRQFHVTIMPDGCATQSGGGGCVVTATSRISPHDGQCSNVERCMPPYPAARSSAG